MKHPKFKYHRWNIIRRYLNNPYKFSHYALLIAWYYFTFKEYEKEI